MKSADVKLPRVTRAPASPMTRTATTTSGHPCRNSCRVKGGAGTVTPASAAITLVARRSASPLRTRTITVRSPGWSAVSSSSSGWAGSGACDTGRRHRPGHHRAAAREPRAVAGLLTVEHRVRPVDHHRRRRPGRRAPQPRRAWRLPRGPRPRRGRPRDGLSRSPRNPARPRPWSYGRFAVTAAWRLASSSASRNWRTCTFQAMATTMPARPAAASPSRAATTGCPTPAVTAPTMASPDGVTLNPSAYAALSHYIQTHNRWS